MLFSRQILLVVLFGCIATSSYAGTIHNSFVTSSTGTAGGLVEGDTIQFEVTVTTTAGRNYDTGLFSLTGDRVAAPGWGHADAPSPAHRVTNWNWHNTPAGGGNVKFGTNGRIVPNSPPIPPPDHIVGSFGFYGISKTGDGIPAMVGTVTITIAPRLSGGGFGTTSPVGVWQGGAFLYPGVDGFFGSAGAETTTVSGGSFTVVPEPGTAALLVMGLALIARASRPSRSN